MAASMQAAACNTGKASVCLCLCCSGTALGNEEGNKEEDSMSGLTVRTASVAFAHASCQPCSGVAWYTRRSVTPLMAMHM